MPEFLRRLAAQFGDVWRGLDFTKKVMFVAIIGLVIGGIAASLLLATRPHYTSLYARLSEKDASTVKAKLEEWRIPHKVEGTQIMVPIKLRDELRIRMAGEDITPQDVLGFKVFDEAKFGGTDFDRKIQFRKALEEEIKRMLKTIKSIEDVDVNIAWPEKTIYIEEQIPVTASLALVLAPGHELKDNQVKAIVNLVANSVEGLKRENVFITDDQGQPLTLPGDEDNEEERKMAYQMWARTKLARQLENKIIVNIGSILSFDRVRVMTDVTMDFDLFEKTMENYRKPGFEQLKASDEEKEIHMEGLAVKPGGQPGVSSNVASYQEILQQPIKYDEKERRTNWISDKEITKMVKSPAIKRLTTSVVVDGTWEIVKETTGKIKERVYKALSKEELETIQSVVQSAIGFDPSRNDIVTVRNIQFDRRAQFASVDAAWERERNKKIAAAAGLVAVVFIMVVAFAVYYYREYQRRKAEELARRREDMMTKAAPALIEAELAAEERQRREMVERIRRTAMEKPELVASVMRTWLLQEA
ncbi:flagellar M-ring protein FliF [bacterium]|nr:flagellar M-ring protein FliF [bacterium]